MSFKQKDKQYIANTYGRFDLHLVSGKGSLVCDDEGKEYIDMATGIAVNTFGANDEAWTAAVAAQLSQIQHTSNLYYSTPCIRLAELLCVRTGAKKVFFGNSGAEANECAIKVARKWAQDTFGKGDYTIITLKNSFHGRTITTLAATGQDVFHTDFNPFPTGFAYATANDLASVEKCFAESKVCAVLMELVQGEGGVLALDKDFVKGVERLCKKYNALLMIDEVQTGNGRTGELYAFQGYGISPDVVSTAKGLGGGLPIGATMLFERVENTLTAGSHGSTFGGNPIAAAGAVSIIERIDEEVLQGVRARSEYIVSELSGAEGIKSVSGLGLMLGVELERNVNEVLADCFQMGVLPIKAKNKLRLLPALNIPMELLERAVAVIKAAAKGERI